MSLLNILPIMPLYYNGRTKFAPIHVTDLVDIIYNLIESQKKGLIMECVGPVVLSFKEIIILFTSLNTLAVVQQNIQPKW